MKWKYREVVHGDSPFPALKERRINLSLLRFLLILSFFLSFLPSLSAEELKGIVTNNAGEPLHLASIYIEERSQGIITDTQGAFRLQLPEGNYTLRISFIGYETKLVGIQLPSNSLSIVLKESPFPTYEVVEGKQQEDAAVEIMKKAIQNAPFYKQQVEEYSTENYMKGSMAIRKIPRITRMSIGKNECKRCLDQLFLIESIDETHFMAPLNYKVDVKAFSSSVPEYLRFKGRELTQVSHLLRTSIYDRRMTHIYSPLISDAFTYYQFFYRGCYTQGDYLIHSIEVKPKKKSPDMFQGTIDIADGEWFVTGFDLLNVVPNGEICMKGIFAEVKPKVFLPVSYYFDVSVNKLGMDSEAKFYASIRYCNLQAKEWSAISVEREKQEENLSDRQLKAKKEVDKLVKKQVLTIKESSRLAKANEELTTPDSLHEQTPHSFELIKKDLVKLAINDSMTIHRDSAWWSQYRSIPLQANEEMRYWAKISEEIRYGYIREQRAKRDSIERERRQHTVYRYALGLVMGQKFRLSPNDWIKQSGLVMPLLNYTYVGGLPLGLDIEYSHSRKGREVVNQQLRAYYGTADTRWELSWRGQLNYLPMRLGRLQFGVGRDLADFNRETKPQRFENGLGSFFLGASSSQFYYRKYLQLHNEVDLMNGLRLTVDVKAEDRAMAHNHTSLNLFGLKVDSNIPTNSLFEPFTPYQAFLVGAGLSYTPAYYYRVINGVKRYEYSKYPTLGANFQYGTYSTGGSFTRVEARASKRVNINIYHSLEMSVLGGSFLTGHELVRFPDLRHAATLGQIVNFRPMENITALPTLYEMSTNYWWLENHFTWFSKYLALKRLPWFQKYRFEESLGMHYLQISDDMTYTEFRYGVDFPRIIGLAFSVALSNGMFESVGLSVSLPFSP